MTPDDLQTLRRRRAARLAQIAAEGMDVLIEPAAYSLLHTGRSWPVAVWRHLRYCLRLWWWSRHVRLRPPADPFE